ncbi:hypothetical protein [Lichenibacterium ramalinae]|nr:hypothetical protein [Lichenibacterium ramalinae]
MPGEDSADRSTEDGRFRVPKPKANTVTHLFGRRSVVVAAVLGTCALFPARAQEAQDDGNRMLVQQCPTVKAKLDRAFSRRPDFASIGDAANERIAECQYYRELGEAVEEGYTAFGLCRDAGAAGIAAKKSELRAILSRIRQAAVHTCDG